MREEHLCHLVCPQCASDLALAAVRERHGADIAEGTLRCEPCARDYEILRHVPRFVPVENYASGFGLEWTQHARTQYDSTSQSTISEQRFFDETGWERALEGQIILEVGSGSGRFTEQAASTGAMVISLDYSYAVEANCASNGHRENVLIVQGDLYHMPVRPGYVDKLFCFGVLQHTPDPRQAFLSLPRHLRPGGALVADIYKKERGLRRLLATKYWVRPLTRRLRPDVLYRWCQRYVHAMWPLTGMIHHLPYGAYLNWRLLLADYRGMYDLSETMQREWAVLDMFDKLAPAYDFPQTRETFQQWFEEAALTDLDVRHGHNGVQGRGRRATAETTPSTPRDA